MYIEFKLPNGSAGQAAAHYNKRIRQSILEWLEANNITDYDIRPRLGNNYYLAFTLSKEEQYTLFLLAWNEPNLPEPKLVVEY